MASIGALRLGIAPMPGPPRKEASSCWTGVRRPIWPASGFTFAEAPDVPAEQARVVISREWDPAVLAVAAAPASAGDPDGVDLAELGGRRVVVLGADGREHVAIGVGGWRLRLDIVRGTMRRGPVRLTFLVSGMRDVEPKLAAIGRLLALVRAGTPGCAPVRDAARRARMIQCLRVADALAAGASQREIATVLFGAEAVTRGWRAETDFMRSRVRRLVATARALRRTRGRPLLRG